ncbi:MAG: DNA polymerase III subunit beta [Patescibacteria group bacterium]
MKIRVLQENLIKAVQDALKFISSKPPIAILSCILLETKDGKLHLRATDLSVSIHAVIGCKVEKDGVVAISGRVFADLLSTLPQGPLDIMVDGGRLLVKSTKASSFIAITEEKDFPGFPEEKGKRISLNLKQLSSLLGLGGVAAGIDETRPMFSCLRFEYGEKGLAVIATDGYRLSRKVEKVSCKDRGGVMVSARIMREVERILQRLAKDSVDIALSEESGQVFFTTGDCVIALRMIEGEYPAYQAIVPQECETQIEVSAAELLSAAKTAMVFSKEVSGIITLKITGKVMFVSSIASTGESNSEVDIKTIKGSSGEISFNGKYLIDFLGAIGDVDLWFGMNESLKPGMFTLPTEKDFYYVVMPFRVTGK